MYKRILLKLSGEALQGEDGFGLNKKKIDLIAKQIINLQKGNIEVAIVLGAGNFWRYRDTQDLKINRNKADKLGMLATIFNCVALAENLKSAGVNSVIYSSFDIQGIAYQFDAEVAAQDLDAGEIVFLSGGTGNPYFTTDSAAVLRALELSCDVVLKATKVNGVYDSDPMLNPKAKKFEKLSYQEAIEKNLKVMDQTAFSLARDNNLPIIVFNILEEGNLEKVVKGEKLGTIIRI